MERVLQAEILDSLPPGDAAARHSRRDLRLLNRLVGNHRWLVRTLTRHLQPGERVLEIGAGTGELGRALATRGIAADGLDRLPCPPGWPASRVWHQADLREFDGYDDYQAVVANLVLHHFTAGELAALGERLRRGPRLVLAAEPGRLRRSRSLFALLAPLFGAHAVTLHDGRASIAAGFVGDELPRALGLQDPAWSLRCRLTLVGVYHLVAVRRHRPD